MRGSLPSLVRGLLVTMLAIAHTLPLLAQAHTAVDPDQLLLGSWQLDVARSRYSPGPPVKSETRVYIRDTDGIKGRIDRQYADGRHEVIDYLAEPEREVPVFGTQAYDRVLLKRIDVYTTEGVLSHAGRVFGYSRRVISPDGETMTITFRREEPGDMVNNMAVYRKMR